MTDYARGRADARLCDIACTIKRETDKAYFVSDGVTEVWLPKSQCEWDRDDQTMAMPEWLAKDKGLI